MGAYKCCSCGTPGNTNVTLGMVLLVCFVANLIGAIILLPMGQVYGVECAIFSLLWLALAILRFVIGCNALGQEPDDDDEDKDEDDEDDFSWLLFVSSFSFLFLPNYFFHLGHHSFCIGLFLINVNRQTSMNIFGCMM